MAKIGASGSCVTRTESDRGPSPATVFSATVSSFTLPFCSWTWTVSCLPGFGPGSEPISSSPRRTTSVSNFRGSFSLGTSTTIGMSYSRVALSTGVTIVGVAVGTRVSMTDGAGVGDDPGTMPGWLSVPGSLGLRTARMMAARMAIITSATPAQRAGDTCRSSPFLGLLAAALRRGDAGFAEAMRRPIERVRTVASSIHADCGTLAVNT